MTRLHGNFAEYAFWGIVAYGTYRAYVAYRVRQAVSGGIGDFNSSIQSVVSNYSPWHFGNTDSTGPVSGNDEYATAVAEQGL